MRKVPVLVVGLATVMFFVGMPVSAATLFGNDLPGYKLKPGETGDKAFDLEDFFDSATTATISYTAVSGGKVDGTYGSVFGDSKPNVLKATFQAQAGGETVALNSVVKVTNFLIGNGPVFDDNNRIAGMDGGAVFYNAIVPGKSLASVKALIGMLADGKTTTPAGVSGGASLVATIGQVSLQTLDIGLRKCSSAVLNGGDGKGKATGAAGITATLKVDGTYSIATTKADFTAPAIVTFGAKAGQSVDGVHFLAAPATDLTLDAASITPLPQGPPATYEFANGALTVTAAQGQYMLFFANAAVNVTGEYATIQVDYLSDSTAANVAAAAFDGALGTEVSYFNPGAANLATGVVKTVALTLKPNSGKVVPAFQVANAGTAAIKVIISRVSVVQAGPLTNYAMNPNVKADLGVDGSVAKIDGWKADILAQGAAAPVAKTDNNFASPTGAGSVYLTGKGGKGLSNAYVAIPLGKGTAVAECYVKRDGDADAGSAFVLIATDGVSPFASFVAGASVPTDKWLKVVTSGTLSAAAATELFAVQAAGLNAFVDDISLRILEESDRYFDPILLGM